MNQRNPSFISKYTMAIFLIASGLQATFAGEQLTDAEAAIVKRGSLLFLQCAACHDVTPSRPVKPEDDVLQKVGPNLYGVLNRPAAIQEEFPYSEALRQAGITWEESTLDKWLKSPAALVPGTTMIFPGVQKEVDRRALIAFLKSIAN